MQMKEATEAISNLKIKAIDINDGKGSGKGGSWVKKDFEAACKSAGLPHTGSVGELKARLNL